MKKEQKNKRIVFEFLNLKFGESTLEIERGDYSRTDFWSKWEYYKLAGEIVFHTIEREDFYEGNISNYMVKQLISWFGNLKYKRRYFKEWLFEKHKIQLPNNCKILIR